MEKGQVYAILAVFILIVVYASYKMTAGKEEPEIEGLKTVEEGDLVSIYYTARFHDGRVYDTNNPEVSDNNLTYPKAPDYVHEPAKCVPLNFTLGKTNPTYPPAVVLMAVEGMAENDTQVVYVSPEDGFGDEYNPNLQETYNYTEHVFIMQMMGTGEFMDNFGEPAAVNLKTLHPFWGWSVTVTSTEGGTVHYRNEPTNGVIYYPFEFGARVTGIDSSANGGEGEITVEYDQNAMDAAVDTVVDDEGGVLLDMDDVNGTFRVEKNPERTWRTIIYEISMLKIVKGEAETDDPFGGA